LFFAEGRNADAGFELVTVFSLPIILVEEGVQELKVLVE